MPAPKEETGGRGDEPSAPTGFLGLGHLHAETSGSATEALDLPSRCCLPPHTHFLSKLHAPEPRHLA